jgi:hypothetical protein
VATQPPNEITCAICDKPLSLDARHTSVDENGLAVHTDCYVDQMITKTKKGPRFLAAA